MWKKLVCRIFGHRIAPDSKYEFEDGKPAVKISYCTWCGDDADREILSQFETCELSEHKFQYADQIEAMTRDQKTGEIQSVTLVRSTECSRCHMTEKFPTPPEAIPPDLFERIEKSIDERNRSTALEGLDLDLGESGPLR